MLSLSCETSTLLGSVAIHNDGQLISYEEQFRQNSHSDSLNLLINTCLTKAKINLKQIDVFCSGLGPGSFTGIRISVNSIKTLSYIHQKPCFGLDSLTNLALINKDLVKSDPFVCGINAFKNMIYLAIYKYENDQLIVLLEPQVIRVQLLHQVITEKMIFIGDAFAAYKKYFQLHYSTLFQRDNLIFDYPKASAIAPIQTQNLPLKHWSELQSFYLRASEAEENLTGIKFQPL